MGLSDQTLFLFIAFINERETSSAVQVVTFEAVNNAIHWMNLYSVDSSIRFVYTYPLNSVICPLDKWAQMKRGNFRVVSMIKRHNLQLARIFSRTVHFDQILAALRTFPDININYYNMSRINAELLYNKYAWGSGTTASKDITRFQSSPGAVTSYMIGQMTFVNARKLMQKSLSARFLYLTFITTSSGRVRFHVNI